MAKVSIEFNGAKIDGNGVWVYVKHEELEQLIDDLEHLKWVLDARAAARPTLAVAGLGVDDDDV